MAQQQPGSWQQKRKRERSPRAKRNPLLLPLILVSIVAVVMSALYITTFIDTSRPETALAEAVDSCDVDPDSPYLYVADDGESLIMTSEGTESPGAPIEEIACVFLMLEVPAGIINRFDTTRALDGTQSGTWDDFEATWNYHPDSGSNITITVVDD
jgi:hypothetical protein